MIKQFIPPTQQEVDAAVSSTVYNEPIPLAYLIDGNVHLTAGLLGMVDSPITREILAKASFTMGLRLGMEIQKRRG